MVYSLHKNLENLDAKPIHNAIREMELPVVKKCLCCFPLRPGIVVWGFIQLVATTLITCAAVTSFAEKSQHTGDTFQLVQMIIFFIITMIVSLLEFIFCGLLVYGAHTKNPNVLEVCFYYLIVKVPVYLLLWLTSVVVKATMVSDSWYYRNLDPWRYTLLMEDQSTGLLDIVFQMYLLILVRSFILQMKHTPHLPSLHQRLKGDYKFTRTHSEEPKPNWEDYRTGTKAELVPIHADIIKA